MHTKLFNPLDDWYGQSPARAGTYAIDQHNESMAWMQALLQNSARPSGALVMKDGETLSDENYARLKAQTEEQYQGAKNAGRPMLLEGGLEWQAMGASPKDMLALDTKYSAARDIALAWGVPPQLLGIPGDNTYANYAEARLAFWEDTILPLLDKLAQDWTNWLGEPFGLELRPDLDQIPAIVDKRKTLWTMLDASPSLTTNEKREAMGYEPIDGGDMTMADAAGGMFGGDQGGAIGDDPLLTGGQDVQASALNGAQISSLVSIAQSVSDGLLPADTAVAIILASFPTMDDQRARALIGPAAAFKPKVDPIDAKLAAIIAGYEIK
jgi:phage portal protein BeeE